MKRKLSVFLRTPCGGALRIGRHRVGKETWSGLCPKPSEATYSHIIKYMVSTAGPPKHTKVPFHL